MSTYTIKSTQPRKAYASCILNGTANIVSAQVCNSMLTSKFNCETVSFDTLCSNETNTGIWFEPRTNGINIYIPNPSIVNNNTQVQCLAMISSSSGGDSTSVGSNPQTLVILLLSNEGGMLKHIIILHVP